MDGGWYCSLKQAKFTDKSVLIGKWRMMCSFGTCSFKVSVGYSNGSGGWTVEFVNFEVQRDIWARE